MMGVVFLRIGLGSDGRGGQQQAGEEDCMQL
jgi:hypothetical protein